MSTAPTHLPRIDAAVFSTTPDNGPKSFGFWIVRDEAGTTEDSAGDPLPETAQGIGVLGFKTRKLAQRMGRDWKTLLARADFGEPEWRTAHSALLRLTLKHGPGLNSAGAQALLGDNS